MRYFATIKIAFRALRRNKMRTVLTMLGIIIGVGAVIAMVGIGNGAKAQVQARIAALGQNVILIFSGSINRGGVFSGFGGAGTLTVEDALAIQNEVPGVAAVSPEVRSGGQIMAGKNNWSTQVMGEGVDYFNIRQWEFAEGAMFTEADVRAAAKVCVLGKTTADKLFPGEDPVGQTIRIKNVPVRVLGVLHAKGVSMMGSGPGRHGHRALHHLHETPRRCHHIARHQRASSEHRPDRRRAERHHRPAPPASPHSTRPRRRLHHPQPAGNLRNRRTPPPKP